MENRNNIIRISVRNLVEFLLRSGSLDTRSGPSSEAAMLEGARIHRTLQKKAGEGYRAEVTLRVDVPVGMAQDEDCADEPGPILRLEGRADGIFFMKDTDPEAEDSFLGGLWTIDEIKTVFRGLRTMEGPSEVHLAQARCYAYMYARRENLDRMKIRMTYCSQVNGEVRFFYEEKSFAELEKWFGELIEAYKPWIGLRLSFGKERQKTIREMTFPFPYREGQYELAAGVYRTIVHGRKLFLQAPTGTGKTMAVLFPSLKAIGEGKAERIFYLTAKGVTGAVPLEALSLLQERGLRLRSLSLLSKERACPREQVDCRPEVCPMADGHFDRVNTALWDLLHRAADGVPMTGEVIAACAEEHRVCPYALSVDAADFADVIICDYNYVFHPQARLVRFFGERTFTEPGTSAKTGPAKAGTDNGTILLIDEAHNLLERGRDLYSAEISGPQVRRFRRSVKNVWPRLWKKMKDLTQVLRLLEKEAAQDVRKIRVLEDWTRPAAEQPKAEQSAAEQPKAEQSAAEQLKAEQSRAEQPKTKQFGAKQESGDLSAGAFGSAGRESLYLAVEEVRDQIRWILEQENRSAALYGNPADLSEENPEGVPEENPTGVSKENLTGSPEENPESAGGRPDAGNKKAKTEPAGLPELLEFYFGLSHFSQMLRGVDEHYIVYTSRGEGKSSSGCSLHLYCADPSGQLRACMEGLTAEIFFSATFLPIQYYKRLLGGGPEDFEMYARSSFSPRQRKVVIVRDVTSRYRDRGEESYSKIARSIGRIVTCRTGNYMVYFPSYAFLEKVLEAFRGIWHPVMIGDEEQSAKDAGNTGNTGHTGDGGNIGVVGENETIGNIGNAGDVFVLAQKREMKEADRAAFLEAFEEAARDRHLIGFCVLGGMFGEGIDLRSDRLIGSLVVGTGIPPVEPQRELLREYFSAQGRNGYDFAYRYPGMNKVLQAAGRVIRTAQDVGIVVLMDGRFSESTNRELFPVEWGSPESVSSETAAEKIRDFWEKIGLT